MKTLRICHYLFFVALLSVMFWSCQDDPEEVLPTIVLSTPAADATVDLSTATGISFSWSVEGTITGGYTLSLSQSAELTSPKTYTSSATSLDITATDLNAVLSEFGVAKGATGKIYWSVKPTSTGVNANLPQARALNVTRPAIPTVELTTPADNATFDLTTVESISFGWNEIAGAPYYALTFSLSPDMSSAQAIEMDANPYILTRAVADAKLEALGLQQGVPTKVYWSVYPCDLSVEFTKQVRSVTITRFKPTPNIVLTAPANNASVSLINGDVIFTWDNVPEITSYKLQLSLTENMASPQSIETTGNPFFVTPVVLNEKLAALGASSSALTTDVYWSIVPYDNVPANTEIRKLTLEEPFEIPAHNANGDLIFQRYGFPNDAKYRGELLEAGTQDYNKWENLFDGDWTADRWFHNNPCKVNAYVSDGPDQVVTPYYLTLDMVNSAAFNRMKYWVRSANSQTADRGYHNSISVTAMEVWASNNPKAISAIGGGDILENLKYWTDWSNYGEGTWRSDWTKIADWQLVLPSGVDPKNKSQLTEADKAFVAKGFDINFNTSGQQYRYLRFVFKDFTEGASQYYQIQLGEFKFW